VSKPTDHFTSLHFLSFTVRRLIEVAGSQGPGRDFDTGLATYLMASCSLAGCCSQRGKERRPAAHTVALPFVCGGFIIRQSSMAVNVGENCD